MSEIINTFIAKLQAISADKRDLPLVIDCPNGLQVPPSIKMRLKEGTQFTPQHTVKSMVITWR